MEWPSFLTTNKKEEVDILLDVSSGGIRGAIVSVKKGAKPKIHYATKEQITIRDKPDPKHLFDLMMDALSQVLERLETDGISHLNFTGLRRYHTKRVVVTLSSPWHVSKTRLITVNHKDEFSVTPELVKDILLKEEKSFEDELLTNNSNPETKNCDFVLERKIIQTKLNGYETTAPYGQKAKSLEVLLFMSLTSKQIVDTIHFQVTKHFNVHQFDFHSLSLVTFVTLRDIYPTVSDFLFVHVNAELTEVSVVKKGVTIETISFPFGQNMITRKVTDNLKNPISVSASLIKLYSQGKIDPVSKAKIEKVVMGSKKDWLDSLYDALANFSEEVFIPKDIFLSVSSDYGSIFLNFLNSASLAGLTQTTEPFSVKILDETHLAKSFTLADRVSTGTFLALEAVFLGRMRA